VNGVDVIGLGPAGGAQALLDPGHFYDVYADVDPGAGTRVFINSGHMGDGFGYMPTVDRFLRFGGFDSWFDGPTADWPIEYSRVTRRWTSSFADRLTGALIPGFGAYFANNTAMAWDSNRGRMYIYNGQFVHAYTPTAPAGSRMRLLADQGIMDANNPGRLLYDPVRDLLLWFGARSFSVGGGASFPNLYWYWNIGANPSSPPLVAIAPGTIGLPVINMPGAVVDPVADEYLFWAGGKTVYLINPPLFVGGSPAAAITTFTPTAGITPTSSMAYGQSAPGGIGERLAYLPGPDAFGTVNDVNEAGVCVFARIRTTPYIECSDIIAGPKTGNSDTSKGQTINVDGALVTAYGFFGGLTPEDTFTVVVNGAAALVYDYGQCLPPRCPATLYNQYRKYEQITFQVPHTAADGLGQIVVTVNGVASVGSAFTVQPGQIYFVAPGGNNGAAGRFTTPWATIQNALDTMISGDTTYVRDGVSELGCAPGLNSGPNGTPPVSTYIALVAYPGAVVQAGDATHPAFTLAHSATGHYMVYSRMRIFGAGDPGQAIDLASFARVSGCLVQAPLQSGKQGAIGTASAVDSVAFDVLCNEFTNCGGDPTDQNYHTLYLAGVRNNASPYLEGFGQSRRVIGNYFHGNNAWRAINIFNGQPPNPNPITGHYVARNVIVDQQSDGILWGAGVVGENWDIANLIVRAGKNLSGDTGQSAAGIWINMGWVFGLGSTVFPDGSFPKAGTILHIWGDTLVDNGAALSGSASGALLIKNTSLWTPDVHGLLVYQTNGQPYIAGQSEAIGANSAQWSKSLWFGNGAPPAFDTSPLNADPLFVGGGNYRLKATSPVRAAGAILSTSVDLDGNVRPSATPWDIGAYQFAGTGSAPPPPPPPTASLSIGFNGLSADRVGQGASALAPDGALDGVVAATLTTSDGLSRTITALRMESRNADNPSVHGTWDTLNGVLFSVLGAALTVGGPYLNNLSTMAVNFTLPNNGQFIVFGANFPDPVTGIDFLPGDTLTLFATLSDGTTATGSVLIGVGPPHLTALVPASANAGSGAFTLTVFGSPTQPFTAGAVINWNGATRTTTFVNATQLTCVIAAADIATAGANSVTVTNPGGVLSDNSLTFNVLNPAPSLVSLAPPSTLAGGAAFTLTLTGTNFVPGSIANWNGTPRPTTYVNAMTLTALITAVDLANAGFASVTITNPAPGGGTSASLAFQILAVAGVGIFVGVVM